MRKYIGKTVGFAGFAALAATSAHATEGGTQHFPIGVNTISSGYLPPPGMLELFNYTQYNWSRSIAGPNGGKAMPDFKLDIYADAPRLMYTPKVEIGPFHYTVGLIVAMVHGKLRVPGARASSTKLGFIDLENYLGYASPDHKFFFYFGLDTYMPTPGYHKEDVFNVASNYWTLSPAVNVTWMPSPKFEITGAMDVEFNTLNKATKYQSGSDIDFDIGTTFRPFKQAPRWGIGVNGYFYQQMGADRIAGIKAANNGNRGREFAIGPQIRYDWPWGGAAIKWQHQYAVENRPRGDRLWLEFAVPLFGTPRK